MKRDLDLIRQLLLRIEAHNSAVSSTGLEVTSLRFTTPPLCLPGEDPAAIEYNVRQLADADYLLLTKTQFAGSVNLHGLSWRGHDFLDSVRDDAVWRKTKEGALAAGGFTWDLLCDVAKGLVKKQIETRTGIAL